jgi:hypothetical protein
MLDRGASINQQQQMAMCNVQDIPTVKYFVFCHIVQRINHYIYIFKKKRKEKEREVLQVPI